MRPKQRVKVMDLLPETRNRLLQKLLDAVAAYKEVKDTQEAAREFWASRIEQDELCGGALEAWHKDLTDDEKMCAYRDALLKRDAHREITPSVLELADSNYEAHYEALRAAVLMAIK